MKAKNKKKRNTPPPPRLIKLTLTLIRHEHASLQLQGESQSAHPIHNTNHSPAYPQEVMFPFDVCCCTYFGQKGGVFCLLCAAVSLFIAEHAKVKY